MNGVRALAAEAAALPETGALADEEPLQTIWETDCRGMSHYQSGSWYRYVGEGVGSSFGEDWLRFYHPDDRGYLKREWQKSLASGGAHPYDIEVRIRRHDGAYRWFRVRGVPQKSSDGQIVKWTGTCTDIHDRRRAEEGAACGGLPPAAATRGGFFSGLTAGMRSGMLERRLFFVVLAGLLPVALLAFATLLSNAQNHKRKLIEAAGDTMRAVVSAVDAELNMSIASLDALAASPRLAVNDFAGFHREARDLLERRPGWANIVLSAPDARQLVNAYLPLGVPLPNQIDPDSIREAVQTGKPGVGRVLFSPVLDMYAFAVRVPILRGNEVVFVLSAVIRPDSMRALLTRQRVPEQSVVSIIDASHSIVARSRGQAESVGKRPSAGLLKLLAEGEESGWGPTNTLEGQPVYSVYHRSVATGWSAALGIPTAALDRPVQRSYAILGGSILLSVLAGFCAAFLVSRSITRPLRELERAALDVGHGQPPLTPATDLPEIREVAQALAAAHVEREKLLQSEREARLRAESLNKAKDEFLAMLGHELRNPLAALTAASEILDIGAAGMPQPAAGAEARAIIRRQAGHLVRLTDDLLDAGRVILGKVRLERKPVDLAQVVTQVVETHRNMGRLADHALTVSTEAAWIDGDATRIDQVIANLLTNAMKYTPAAGAIDVSLVCEDGQAVLRVRDSGIGLEPGLQARVFDLFVQGERSLERAQGGLGIGLTVVRRLAELHGGSVEARSEGPGQGSEFIVRLPLIGAPADKGSGASGAIRHGTRTIAIIEDNDDFRDSLRSLLELAGHRVIEAADGRAGVDLVLRERADVALVDIGLPLLDGYGVARTLRERGSYRGRLIEMSGYGSADDMERGARAGFDTYLVKPVELEKLLAAIDARS
ncbi:MAG TPA: ATP-binding protein [Noviherbaspirillum sp.]|uniref:ATP-binding protein n=1 Tax=Noviherbaspirillum sp. TaxID=1926288 RepID=UPI002D64BA0B|nr:ATP-binding protein [Noviherbaspirillum sp.]HYD96534.1 ATP-binding protein [Noviherbaspirillum sp.]